MTDTTTQAVTALRPCPFCGGQKFQCNTKAKGYFVKKAAERAGRDTSNHLVRCTKCGSKGPLSASEDDAKTAWNARASTALLAERDALLAERDALAKGGK